MTQHNVGALVVVKPGEKSSIAGIITERGEIRFFFSKYYPLYFGSKVDVNGFYISRLSQENHCSGQIIKVDQGRRHHD